MADVARIETGTIPGIAADRTLFPVEKMDAHRRGVLHQAISIFVFDGDLLLLQRRAKTKYHSGGLWANTCCSHPVYGETQDACANRRLREELGFDTGLTRRATVDYHASVGDGLWENERVAVFEGVLEGDRSMVRPNPEEVCEVRWMSLPDVLADITARPQAYTPWLRIYVDRWQELGLSKGAQPLAAAS